MNYVVGGTTPMDDIPDHAIQSPFGSTSEKMKTQHERFQKYRHYIVPWFKDLYNVRMYCKGGFNCSVCNEWLGSNQSCRLLAHLASLKHLKAALGDELQESDKRYRRRVGSKHTKDSTATPVNGVVADISGGLGE